MINKMTVIFLIKLKDLFTVTDWLDSDIFFVSSESAAVVAISVNAVYESKMTKMKLLK